MARTIDPDQTLRSSASDLGLHCLLKQIIFTLTVGIPRLTILVLNLNKSVFLFVDLSKTVG